MRRPEILVKLLLPCAIMYLLMLGLSSIAAGGARSIEASMDEGLRLIKSDAQSIVVELRTPSYDIEEVRHGGTVYHLPSVPGYAHNDMVGHPQLPLEGTLLGIPAQAQADVRILAAEGDIVAGRYNIYPVPRPIIAYDLASGLAEDVGSELVQDQSVYAVNAFYPTDLARITSSGLIRDQRFVHLQLYPFQYSPVTQELKFYQRLRVEISLSYPYGAPSMAASGEIDSPFESALRNTILNYESARSWRQGSTRPALLEATGLDTCEECYKISIREEGIYRLTYPELQAAGVPVDPPGFIDPRNFHIYNGGEEIAIYVHGQEDGNFDVGDYVLFYGEEVNTKYTNTNIYWFTTGGAQGKRIQDKPGEGVGTTPAWFEATERLEVDYLYIPWLPFAEAEHWYWEQLQPVSQPVTGTYTFTLSNIYTAEAYSATLRSELWGASLDDGAYPDHHAKVYVNDYLVEDASWDDKTRYQVEVDFPSSVLLEGQNTIEVVCPGDTGAGSDVVVTDWFEITYRDTHVAEENSLAFAQDGAGTWEYQINDFTEPWVEVYDITDPIAVSRIISTTITPIESAHTLTFTQEIASPAHYLALTVPERKSVLSIIEQNPYDLKNPANSAEYLIITHPDFYDNVLRLASHRAAQFDTMVVDVEDVYFWFSDGLFDPQAIKDFLTYAYNQWATGPSYVLLVGDGNYDFKDNWADLGYGEPNYIPPYLACVDLWQCEIESDNQYVCVSGEDNMADMYIGRLPVKTSAEADAAIDKILAYEASPLDGWKRRTLFVADDPDDDGNFRALSDYVADNHLPPRYTAQKVYYLEDSYSTPAAVTTAIIDGINEGRLLVNYFGHGYIPYWGAEKFLEESSSRNDLASLTNDDRFPMILSMSCYISRFSVPSSPSSDRSCLSESLVRAEGKGAVATWAASGLGESDGHKFLDAGFFTAVFTDGVVEIGAATTQAKWGLASHLYLRDQYILFGDPAMRLAVQYNSFASLVLNGY